MRMFIFKFKLRGASPIIAQLEGVRSVAIPRYMCGAAEVASLEPLQAGCILVKRFDPNAYKFCAKRPPCPIAKVQRLRLFSAVVRSQMLTQAKLFILGSIHVRTKASGNCYSLTSQ